jgi:hypothetical protein
MDFGGTPERVLKAHSSDQVAHLFGDPRPPLGRQGDLEALRDIEGRIEDELRRLEKMEKHNEGIRKNSDGIADEIRKARRQLDLLLRNAKSTLAALNVELQEETIERSTPITLPSESYATATIALEALSSAEMEAG